MRLLSRIHASAPLLTLGSADIDWSSGKLHVKQCKGAKVHDIKVGFREPAPFQTCLKRPE